MIMTVEFTCTYFSRNSIQSRSLRSKGKMSLSSWPSSSHSLSMLSWLHSQLLVVNGSRAFWDFCIKEEILTRKGLRPISL